MTHFIYFFAASMFSITSACFSKSSSNFMLTLTSSTPLSRSLFNISASKNSPFVYRRLCMASFLDFMVSKNSTVSFL